MSEAWTALIDRFEICQSNSGDIDSAALLKGVLAVSQEALRTIPGLPPRNPNLSGIDLNGILSPIFGVIALSHGTFQLLKKNSSKYGQVEKHAVVDLWSEEVAVSAMVGDLLKAINEPRSKSELLLLLDALVGSASALSSHVATIAARFIGIKELAPTLDKLRADLLKSKELLGRVEFSKETTLPY